MTGTLFIIDLKEFPNWILTWKVIWAFWFKETSYNATQIEQEREKYTYIISGNIESIIIWIQAYVCSSHKHWLVFILYLSYCFQCKSRQHKC